MSEEDDSYENGHDLEFEDSNDSLDALQSVKGSGLDRDRLSARRALKAIVSGKMTAKPGQMMGIKMILKDELEPEKAPNPYAGIAETELAERMIVTACSVLGVKRLTEILMGLAKLGEADVLHGLEAFEPDGSVSPGAPVDEPLREKTKTDADEGPQVLHS